MAGSAATVLLPAFAAAGPGAPLAYAPGLVQELLADRHTVFVEFCLRPARRT